MFSIVQAKQLDGVRACQESGMCVARVRCILSVATLRLLQIKYVYLVNLDKPFAHRLED